MYDFSKDFEALGILPGDTVLMHSSMKALGTDETPQSFLFALCDYLGEKGTLLLPKAFGGAELVSSNTKASASLLGAALQVDLEKPYSWALFRVKA